MEEDLLKEIVLELKGLRGETVATNQRLDGLNNRVDGLNNRVDGLTQSVIVFQQGVSDLRYEMRQIKEILGEKVIWQNDSISLETREGKVIYGIIPRESRK